MLKSAISPTCLQEVLESAANALDKGQAQYFTPTEWATHFARPLPQWRHTLVDLTAGKAHLLRAAANPTTEHLLALDIEPLASIPGDHKVSRLTGDLTRLFPLFEQVRFAADCFTLNFPFDHHWYRERLQSLAAPEAGSTLRSAFTARDGRTSAETIDSTIAGWLIALHLSSGWGEGYLIANHDTLERLVFGPDAPHADLALHAWARVIVRAPIWGHFVTDVIYWARGHESGLSQSLESTLTVNTAAEAEAVFERLSRERRFRHQGSTAKEWAHTKDTALKWEAVRAEWKRLQEATIKPVWNLWLGADATIRTALTLFDQHNVNLNKAEAGALHQLSGKHPMQLVLQRAQREALRRAAFDSPWRVSPELQQAVTQAEQQYHAVRAPLYPLSKIMRLGHLDEHDFITCQTDLSREGDVLFRAGQRYKVRTQTVAVNRKGSKVNLSGETEEVEFNGQELAIFLTDRWDKEQLFMEERLRAEDVKITGVRKAGTPSRRTLRGEPEPNPIDFTLQQLCDHFEIPDAPDIATLQPANYQQFLDTLIEIETACPEH